MIRTAFIVAASFFTSTAFAGLSSSPLGVVVQGPGTSSLVGDFVLYNANGDAVEVVEGTVVTFPNGEKRFRMDGFDHVAAHNPDNLVCVELDANAVTQSLFRRSLGWAANGAQGPLVGNLAGSWSETCSALGDL